MFKFGILRKPTLTEKGEIEAANREAIETYLANGGTVTKCPPKTQRN